MTQEHTDKKEILDTCQYNHKTKSKTNAICPHYDNLNNGIDSSTKQNTKEVHRSYIISNMETPSKIKSVDITSVTLDNAVVTGKYQKRRITSNKNQLTKKNDVDGSIKKLNKLKEEIANKLNEVKGVLNKYGNESGEENPTSKNEPVKFRFVRRVRRKSSLLDDIEKAQSSRVTDLSEDANAPIDFIDKGDKTKIESIQSIGSKSTHQNFKIIDEEKFKNSAIEKVQYKISDLSIPVPEVGDKTNNEEQNICDSKSTVEIDRKVDKQDSKNENIKKENKLIFENVIKKPAAKKIIVKKSKTSKANMIVENSEFQDIRRSSIAITEPSSLKNSMNEIPLKERRLSDSFAITLSANNNENQFKVDVESDIKLTNRLQDINTNSKPSECFDTSTDIMKLETEEILPSSRTLEESTRTKHFMGSQENINLNEATQTLKTLDLPNLQSPEKEVLRKSSELETVTLVSDPLSEKCEALDIAEKKYLENRNDEQIIESEKLELSLISSVDVENVDSAKPITITAEKVKDNFTIEKALDLASISLNVSEVLCSNINKSDPSNLLNKTENNLSTSYMKSESSTTNIPETTKEQQATPGKIIRRKTPKIKRESSKAPLEIKIDESRLEELASETESLDNQNEQPLINIEPLTNENITRKPKAKRKVIIRKIKRRLSKEDPFSHDSTQETTPIAEISEKDIFENEENVPDMHREETRVKEKELKTILKLREFKEGDVVRYGERFKKTGLRWKQAKIIERITSISYKLNINGEEKTVHAGFLKRENDLKVNFGGKEYLEIDYEQIEEEEEAERNYSIWDRT
ncbi:hypothetical protein ACFFRR_005336 [Megaselia abdita]